MNARYFLYITAVSITVFLHAGVVLVAQQHADTDSDQIRQSDTDLDDPVARAGFFKAKLVDPRTGKIPEGIRARELKYAATLPTWVYYGKGAAVSSGADTGGTGVWLPRGPINNGGRTRALGIDVANEAVILAGGVSGGMWRSIDTGATWALTTLPHDIHSVTCLAQDTRPGNTNVWYYGTGEYRANSADLRGDGIFKTTDGGLTWRQLESTMHNTPQTHDQMFEYVWEIVVDPSNPFQDEVYAATFGGVMRSTDGGESWDAVLGSFQNNAAYADIAITSAGVLYATLSSSGRNEKGIYRSEDGLTWTNITPTEWPALYGRIVIGIAPSNENRVYFFANTQGSGKDNNSLWTLLYTPPSGGTFQWENRSEYLPDGLETYTSYCVVIDVKPDDEDVVFLGTSQFHVTTDGFTSLDNIETQMSGGTHADYHSAQFFPSNPKAMVSGHDGGISITRDNTASRVSWELRNNGYATSQFYSIAIDHATESDVLLGGMQDNGTWFLNTDTTDAMWSRIFGADGGYCFVADSGSSYYISTQRGPVYRYLLDSLGRRIASTRVSPEGGANYLFISPYILDPVDTRMMYLAEGRNVWRNSNLTEIPLNRANTTDINWTRLQNSQIPNGSVTAFGVARVPAHRLYVGSSNGQLYRLENAHQGDPAPVDIWSGKGFPQGYISSIAVDPYDGDKAMVAFSNYNTQSLFYTTDAGETWEAIGGNLEEEPDGSGAGPSCSWASILPVGNQRMYFVGTTAGLYSTNYLDGDNTVWIQEDPEGIGNVVVDMVDVREADGFVAIGTHGRGAYTTYIGPERVAAILQVLPDMVVLGGIDEVDTVSAQVEMVNAGVRPIELELEELTEPFVLVGGGGSTLLLPGDTLRKTVRFMPSEVGLFNDVLVIHHDADDPIGDAEVLIRGGNGVSSVDDEQSGYEGYMAEWSPNPTQGKGLLALKLPRGGKGRLAIFDAAGKKVAVLVDGVFEQGEQTLVWETAEYPTGIYYSVLELNGERIVRQIVVER